MTFVVSKRRDVDLGTFFPPPTQQNTRRERDIYEIMAKFFSLFYIRATTIFTQSICTRCLFIHSLLRPCSNDRLKFNCRTKETFPVKIDRERVRSNAKFDFDRTAGKKKRRTVNNFEEREFFPPCTKILIKTKNLSHLSQQQQPRV